MTQNLPKNIIGSVASIYKANLVIEIPNITKNYVNSHLFTCRHWVAACLFKYTSRCWEVYLIGQIFFCSEGLGAKRNASGKLGVKLAIHDIMGNLISYSNYQLVCRSWIILRFLRIVYYTSGWVVTQLVCTTDTAYIIADWDSCASTLCTWFRFKLNIPSSCHANIVS